MKSSEYGSGAPRVLIVDLSDGRAGVMQRSLHLATAAPETTSLGVVRDSALEREAQARGLETHRLGAHWLDPMIPGRLSKLIRSLNIEIVDSHNARSLVWTSRVVPEGPAALVATLDDLDRDRERHPLVAAALARLGSAGPVGISRFVVPHEAAADVLLRRGIARNRVRVASLGIEAPNVDLRFDRAWLQRTYGVPPTGAAVIASGSHTPGGGHEDLLTAMSTINTAHLDCKVHLLLFGEGSSRELVLESVSKGVSGLVSIRPRPSDEELGRALATSDVFVHPTIFDDLSADLLYAAAVGTSIVASNTPMVQDTFRDGEAAVLTAPGDSAAIAEAVASLAASPGDRSRLGRAGTAAVAERHSPGHLVATTTRVYERVADQRVSV